MLPCVVFLHGNSGCRVDAYDAVRVLLPLNITVFCLDLSGSGLSEGCVLLARALCAPCGASRRRSPRLTHYRLPGARAAPSLPGGPLASLPSCPLPAGILCQTQPPPRRCPQAVHHSRRARVRGPPQRYRPPPRHRRAPLRRPSTTPPTPPTSSLPRLPRPLRPAAPDAPPPATPTPQARCPRSASGAAAWAPPPASSTARRTPPSPPSSSTPPSGAPSPTAPALLPGPGRSHRLLSEPCAPRCAAPLAPPGAELPFPPRLRRLLRPAHTSAHLSVRPPTTNQAPDGPDA